MNENKHTPGPWTHHTNERNVIFVESKAKGKTVCSTIDLAPPNAKKRSEYRANAHLIAAAPELLAACEMVLNNRSSHDGRDNEPDWVIAVRDAVDKATGATVLTSA